MRNVGDFSELGAIGGSGDMSVFTEQPVENFEADSNPDGSNTYDLPTLSQQVDGLRQRVEAGFAGVNEKMDKGFAEILSRLPPGNQ